MIELEGLTHRYDDVVAVEDVTATIGDDEFVLLVGPNGSGKTTLVRHLNALLQPDEGVLRVNGRRPTEAPVAARTAVGMVFQHPRDQFVAATVGADVAFGPENLGLERAEIDRRVDDALAAVGLADRAEDRIATLSGGEEARVAIAGALAMEPTHLVLDEPLAGLDLSARRSVLERLDDLAAGGTGIFLVTHDLRDLLDRADRLLAMREGRLAADVAPGEAEDALEGLAVRVPGC